MIIFPAIDIRGGKCVRLVEGKFDQETVYGDDPAVMAERFSAAGAKFIHVVDLDGALAGQGRNLAVIKRIIDHARIPIELGGGIRTLENVAMMLELGVSRVILGSAAVRSPELVAEALRHYPKQVVVGIDAKHGEVAVEGWGVGSGLDYIEFGKKMAGLGLEHVIFTDISRDGKLSGVNVEATAKLARETGLKVVASGGVASLQDLEALKQHEEDGIEGVIIGKALYSGAIDLKAALALAGPQD